MTLQEAAEKYADENFNTSGIYTPYEVKQKLIACYKHRQAEIDELKAQLKSLVEKVSRSTTLMIYTEPIIETEIEKSKKLLST